MSQESSATELEVAMLYSQALAESDDEDDVFLRALQTSPTHFFSVFIAFYSLFFLFRALP